MIFTLKYLLLILLLSSFAAGTTAQASQEFKKKPVKMTSPVKKINPKVMKTIKNVGKIEMLPDTEYQQKIKAHDLKLKSQAVGIKQKAKTNISFQSQNHAFRGSYDCNDNDAAVKPGSVEACDGIDNDCDGDIDEGVTARYFLDADSDRYGDASKSLLACSAPRGYVARDDDCNDKSVSVNPGKEEIPGNDIDENCDGSK